MTKLARLLGWRRPYNLSDQNAKSWQIRANKAASLVGLISGLPQPIRVVEVGAGDRKLESALRQSYAIDYQGYDILPQSPDVRPWNAEDGFPPDLGDVTFALGLLEYLTAPERIFAQIGKSGHNFIFSYVTSDAGRYSGAQLRRLGWKTHHSRQEIEILLSNVGLEIVSLVDMTPDPYAIWLVRPMAAKA